MASRQYDKDTIRFLSQMKHNSSPAIRLRRHREASLNVMIHAYSIAVRTGPPIRSWMTGRRTPCQFAFLLNSTFNRNQVLFFMDLEERFAMTTSKDSTKRFTGHYLVLNSASYS